MKLQWKAYYYYEKLYAERLTDESIEHKKRYFDREPKMFFSSILLKCVSMDQCSSLNSTHILFIQNVNCKINTFLSQQQNDECFIASLKKRSRAFSHKKEKCVELCWAEGTNNDEKYANGNFDARFVHQTIPFNVCCLFLFVFFGLGTFLLDSTHLHFYQQKASFSIGGNRTQGRSVKKCFEVVNYLVCSSIR